MRVILAECPNNALHDGLYHLYYHGRKEESRNGSVIVSPTPVMTKYRRPRNRVLVSATRDANPFFHLFESLWMLAGRNDLAFPQKFIKNFNRYSDDGETLHGAYGYRWRHVLGFDQLFAIVNELRENPHSRRCVLQMWDGAHNGCDDLRIGMSGGKDVPCNTQIYFNNSGGKLDMTVTCRSNDAIWGAHGANVVHFSILHEFVAQATGMNLGYMYQFSNNYHVYEDVLKREEFPSYADSVWAGSVYSEAGVLKHRTYHELITPVPLFHEAELASSFLAQCDEFCEYVLTGKEVEEPLPFFDCVAIPMFRTWSTWKTESAEQALSGIYQIRDEAWRLGAQTWLRKRVTKGEGK